MKKKFVFSIIIVSVIVIILASGIINKNYASEEIKQQKYSITENEEQKFLTNIYNTETETLKIKSINKEETDQNYISKEKSKTEILDNSNEQYIRNYFGNSENFDDGEYKGTLVISNIDIQNINNGYYEKIDEKKLNFNNYNDNDLNNISKEITIDNVKYYLINVEWEADQIQNIDGENVPLTYKGTQIYQTIKKVKNPDTYKVTVTYSGNVEKINKIYNYTVIYEEGIEDYEEINEKNNIPIFIIISGVGLVAIIAIIINNKNTYIYSKIHNGFKLIKREKLNNKKLIVDISNCKNKSDSNIYAIKLNSVAFKKLKGRTISIVLGNKKKDLVIWNDYYEIKM